MGNKFNPAAASFFDELKKNSDETESIEKKSSNINNEISKEVKQDNKEKKTESNKTVKSKPNKTTKSNVGKTTKNNSMPFDTQTIEMIKTTAMTKKTVYLIPEISEMIKFVGVRKKNKESVIVNLALELLFKEMYGSDWRDKLEEWKD